jgi:hypothetical protein
MQRQLEIEAGAARPGAPVIDVMGKALLAAVEIDGGRLSAGQRRYARRWWIYLNRPSHCRAQPHGLSPIAPDWPAPTFFVDPCTDNIFKLRAAAVK